MSGRGFHIRYDIKQPNEVKHLEWFRSVLGFLPVPWFRARLRTFPLNGPLLTPPVEWFRGDRATHTSNYPCTTLPPLSPLVEPVKALISMLITHLKYRGAWSNS